MRGISIQSVAVRAAGPRHADRRRRRYGLRAGFLVGVPVFLAVGLAGSAAAAPTGHGFVRPAVTRSYAGPSAPAADNSPTVYVANFGSDTVTPISTATNTAGPAITVGNSPYNITITPDGKTVYVGDGNSTDTITPISTTTNTAGPAIPAGGGVNGIVAAPDGKTVYAADFYSGTATGISTATNTAFPTATVGDGPMDLDFTPDSKTVYVVNSFSDNVTPITVATNTPGPPIPVGDFPVGIAITPDGQTVYVSNDDSGTVTPITVATNTAGPAIAVGSGPQTIAITPDGKTAYVANEGGDTVTPITIATNTPGTPITVGQQPGDMVISPDGKTLYVANIASDTVTPITIATNTAGPAIPIGSQAWQIAITPDGKTAYVSNRGSNSVTPINLTTNTAEPAIPVGPDPHGLVITPGPEASAPATLKVCKVAGSGVGVGTSFVFTVNNRNITVPAGPAPGGYCVLVPGSFTQGEQVTVTEQIPNTMSVTNIRYAGGQLISKEVPQGSITVDLGPGVTETTFTDAVVPGTGYLEICNSAAAGITSDYAFTYDGQTIRIPAGACSPAVQVHAGALTIQEGLKVGSTFSACKAIPGGRVLQCYQSTRTAVVVIVPGDITTQTIAEFVNI